MTVDIIIPCYNQEQYLAEAIQSVIKQTYSDWLLYLVIDGSPDCSYDIAMNYQKLYPDKISVFNLPENLGLTSSRMFGVNSSMSEYILFLDSDDYIHCFFLEKTIFVLQSNPEYAYCYTDTTLVDEKNNLLGYWNQPEFNFHDLLLQNYICYCNLLRRKIFLDCGGYDLNNSGGCEDLENSIRMGKYGHYGKHLGEKLFFYRQHSGTMTSDPQWKQLEFIYKCYIISKHLELYPRNWGEEAINIMKQLPEDFMKMRRFDRIKFLK